MSPIPSIYAHLVRVVAHSLSRARTHRVHTPGDTIVSPREYRARTFLSVFRCTSSVHLRELRVVYSSRISAANKLPFSPLPFSFSIVFDRRSFSTVGCHGSPRYCYYQPYDNDIIEIRNSKNNHPRTRNTILSRRSFYHTTTRFFVLSLSPFCRFWFTSGTTVSACHSAED